MPEFETTPTVIDWLTALAPHDSKESFFHHLLKGQTYESIRTAYHHQNAVRYYPSGIRLYFTPRQIGLPPICVLDGEANAYFRSAHSNEYAAKIAGILAKVSHHFTRVDLATDILDGGQVAYAVADRVYADTLDTGLRKAHIRREGGEGQGITTYFGRRTSPKFLRIYDKNAETRGKVPATRIEFELKQDAARSVSDTLGEYRGFEHIPHLFVGLLADFPYFEDFPAIEALRYGETRTVDLQPRESQLSKKQWLSRQVLPTFVKHWDTGGSELWEWFKEQVETAHGQA